MPDVQIMMPRPEAEASLIEQKASIFSKIDVWCGHYLFQNSAEELCHAKDVPFLCVFVCFVCFLILTREAISIDDLFCFSLLVCFIFLLKNREREGERERREREGSSVIYIIKPLLCVAIKNSCHSIFKCCPNWISNLLPSCYHLAHIQRTQFFFLTIKLWLLSIQPRTF